MKRRLRFPASPHGALGLADFNQTSKISLSTILLGRGFRDRNHYNTKISRCIGAKLDIAFNLADAALVDYHADSLDRMPGRCRARRRDDINRNHILTANVLPTGRLPADRVRFTK